MESKNPLELVYEFVGGDGKTEQRTKVAELCGVSRQAVELWEKSGIPGKHILTLETATDRRVSARELLEWSAQKRIAA